jgi:hypothetical protein
MAHVCTSASKGEVIASEILQRKFVRDISDASTALPEDERATDAVLGVLSAVVLGGDLRGSWSWHQRSGCGEKAPKLPSAPVASPAGFDGVPSAVVLGDDLQGSWSWHQRSGCGEKAPKLPSAPVACPAGFDGVPSALVLGDDLQGSWSWHQRSGCGEKAPKLPSAPVACPAGFDGVPSAVVLGDDLRDSWSWHQRSGRLGQKGTKGKEEITDKDVPPRFPKKQPRFKGAPSSAVTGNAADRMQAWQWR